MHIEIWQDVYGEVMFLDCYLLFSTHEVEKCV